MQEEKPSFYYEGRRENMVKYLPPSAKSILDVGCSSGNFLTNFDSKSLFRAGVEPDRKSYESAKGKMEECYHGNFDLSMVEKILNQSSQKKFDCIFYNDVLEHLEKPWEALDLSKKLLNEGGSIIASVPNLMFYINMVQILKEQDFKYVDAGIMDITHLRFFTKKSLVRMFESCGFEIINLEGISRTSSWKFKLLNFLLMNRIYYAQYMQLVVEAKVKK